MKKTLLVIGGAMLLGHSAAIAQRCGMQQMHDAMIAKHPEYAAYLQAQKASLQASAEDYLQLQAMNAEQKTTTTISAVPIIFHIVVDSAQFLTLGGTAGIIKRCDSQIAVLNRDYNKQNADSTLIPTSWKSLYGNAGIKFALARRTPTGTATPGYEIKITTATGFSNINSAFPEAKTATTGLVAWDVTKYYNVWCVNFSGSASSLLGITVPKSDVTSGFYPADEEGVVILYQTLGSQVSGAGSFFSPYNLGRTLTHETGHFFEIWHTWGDDGGLCPWNGGGDDGISDTPPESDAVYGNPAYTISGGTYNDTCKLSGSVNKQPIGIACLSYMDYTDDNAMHLFTTMQAAAMASKVLVSTGENFPLTQNPSLTTPIPTEVIDQEIGNLNIYPNPTNALVNVSFDGSSATLQQIDVFNMIGQQVMMVTGIQGKDYYSIDLSRMSKGIYIVKCNFASGSVTRKILLQ